MSLVDKFLNQHPHIDSEEAKRASEKRAEEARVSEHHQAYGAQGRNLFDLYCALKDRDFVKAAVESGVYDWVVGATSDYVDRRIPESERALLKKVSVGDSYKEHYAWIPSDGIFASEGRDEHLTIPLGGAHKAHQLYIRIAKSDPELFDISEVTERYSANGYFRGRDEIEVKSGLRLGRVLDYVEDTFIGSLSHHQAVKFQNWLKENRADEFKEQEAKKQAQEDQKHQEYIKSLPPLSDERMTAQFDAAKKRVHRDIDKKAEDAMSEIAVMTNQFRKDFE